MNIDEKILSTLTDEQKKKVDRIQHLVIPDTGKNGAFFLSQMRIFPRQTVTT